MRAPQGSEAGGARLEVQRVARLPIVRRVERFIRTHALLHPGDRVLVAVSGGADSVFLLRALDALSAPLGVAVEVAHFNHGWRGAAAGADAEFVGELAAAMGRQAHFGAAGAAPRRRARARSREEVAREARYAFFARICAERGMTHVATGHTLDDQVETYLMGWLRGAGPAGLAMPAAGPLPVARPAARVVRPLLVLDRFGIRRTLAQIGQAWREDATNADPSYLRNRVRHELIPLLDSLSPGFRTTILRSSELARRAAGLLERAARAAERSLFRVEDGGLAADRRAFQELDAALPAAVLGQAVRHLTGSARDLESAHLEAAVRLIERGAGGRGVPLGPSVHLSLRRGRIILQRR